MTRQDTDGILYAEIPKSKGTASGMAIDILHDRSSEPTCFFLFLDTRCFACLIAALLCIYFIAHGSHSFYLLFSKFKRRHFYGAVGALRISKSTLIISYTILIASVTPDLPLFNDSKLFLAGPKRLSSKIWFRLNVFGPLVDSYLPSISSTRNPNVSRSITYCVEIRSGHMPPGSRSLKPVPVPETHKSAACKQAPPTSLAFGRVSGGHHSLRWFVVSDLQV